MVVVRRPYKAYWDNVLSILLSLQLVLIMLCGMALEMNRLTPEEAVDPYESTSFGLLMVAFSVIIVVTAILAILVSIPCARDPLVRWWVKYVAGAPKKKNPVTNSNDQESKMNNNVGAGAGSETKESHVSIEMTGTNKQQTKNGLYINVQPSSSSPPLHAVTGETTWNMSEDSSGTIVL